MPGVATYKYRLVADCCASMVNGAANMVQSKNNRLRVLLKITFMAVEILGGKQGLKDKENGRDCMGQISFGSNPLVTYLCTLVGRSNRKAGKIYFSNK